MKRPVLFCLFLLSSFAQPPRRRGASQPPPDLPGEQKAEYQSAFN